MIDIHSHIIPEIDDGSENTEDSLELIKKEVEQGVSDIICTPHGNCEKYDLPVQDVISAFENLKKEVEKSKINVNLYLGQEILYSRDIKDRLKNDRLITLNNGKYLLIEYLYSKNLELVETVYSLSKDGYVPIVAHYERYAGSNVEQAREIKEVGGKIQVNARSVCKGFSEKNFVKKLIKENLVDFVASDIHYGREDCMENAYKYVCAKFGEDVANRLFYENAMEIIKG